MVMGCGASLFPTPIDTPSPFKSQNGSFDLTDGAGDHQFQQSNSNAQNVKEPTESSSDPTSVLRVERFVAFEIPFNDSAAESDSNAIDAILMRPLPPRLRHLAPLDNPPVLSAEQLAEKQTRAEEKRQKSVERRKAKAQREAHKLARALQNRDEQQSPATATQLRLDLATRKREAQLRGLQRKQQIIQERGRLARQRVRRMRQEETVGLDFEIEKFDEDAGDSPEETQDPTWGFGVPKKRDPLSGSSGYVSRDTSASSEASDKKPARPYLSLVDGDFFDQQLER